VDADLRRVGGEDRLRPAGFGPGIGIGTPGYEPWV